MRQKEPPRVLGPYKERNRWRLVIFDEKGRHAEYFESEVEAQRQRKSLSRTLDKQVTRKLGVMIARYEQEKIDTGRSLPRTALGEQRCLMEFFGPNVEQDLAAVTPRRAAVLYEQATARVSRKTGRPLSAASHRAYLEYAKTFCSWAVDKKYLTANPFQDVKPRGKPNRGKTQLRIEEAQRFIETALLPRSDEDPPLSIAALAALYMGLRANEILMRRVRDLDAGGRILWIDSGKTHNARRHLKVPGPLQPLLRQLGHNKSADAFLFGEREPGQPHMRQTLWREVRRLCVQAGVPVVCTHSLRGLFATLAVEAGAVSDAVAMSLGHGSFAMTERHYAAPASVHSAKAARVESLLDGWHRLEEANDEEADEVRKRLLKLDRPTLARLLELASQDGSRRPN